MIVQSRNQKKELRCVARPYHRRHYSISIPVQSRLLYFDGRLYSDTESHPGRKQLLIRITMSSRKKKRVTDIAVCRYFDSIVVHTVRSWSLHCTCTAREGHVGGGNRVRSSKTQYSDTKITQKMAPAWIVKCMTVHSRRLQQRFSEHRNQQITLVP